MKLTIQKFDPSVDKEPYFKDYEVPWEELMPATLAFKYIDDNIEPLVYDYSCRGRDCGRCSVMIDGEGHTACTAILTDEPHTVEPLKGVPIVRDLVVDKSDMQNRIVRMSQRVRAEQINIDDVTAPIPFDIVEKLETLECCSRCLACNASCPVRSEMPADYIGPAGMVAISLRHFDTFDEEDRIAQAVQEGLWNCIMCGKCDEVCHTLEIEHLKTWQELRDEATKRGLVKSPEKALPFNS